MAYKRFKMKKIIGWILLSPLIVVGIIFLAGAVLYAVQCAINSTLSDWIARGIMLCFLILTYFGFKLIEK